MSAMAQGGEPEVYVTGTNNRPQKYHEEGCRALEVGTTLYEFGNPT